MKNGDLVTIRGRLGTVEHAVIVDMRPSHSLPDVPLAESDEARAILRKECFRVAVIEHDCYLTPDRKPTRVTFVALESNAGIWYDLHGEPLELIPEKKEAVN